MGAITGAYTQIIPAGTKLTTWYPDRPGQGDNFLGMLIEPPNATKTFSRKLLILSHTDAQEMTGGPILQAIINELLSGSFLSRRTLSAVSVLVIPFQLQQAVTDGLSRYGLDCPMLGNTGWNAGQNGYSEAGDAIVDAAIANWLADHPDPNNAIFGRVEFHCDYINVPFATVTFAGLNAADSLSRFLEGFHPDPAFCDLTGIAGGSGLGDNTPGFIIELPWREPSRRGKPNLWWDGDDLANFGVEFLKGISAATTYTASLVSTTRTGVAITSSLSFTHILLIECPAEPIVESATLTQPAGYKTVSGNVSAISGSAALGTAVGIKTASVGVNTLTGTATLAVATGQKDAHSQVNTIVGTASLVTPAGYKTVQGQASTLTGTATLAATVGSKYISGQAYSFTGTASLATAVGHKDFRASLAALTATATLGTPTGWKNALGVATAISSPALLSAGYGWKATQGAANIIVGSATLATTVGYRLVSGAANDITATVTISVATGRKTALTVADALSGTSALSIVTGWKTSLSSALALTGASALSNVQGTPEKLGAALNLIGIAALSLPTGEVHFPGFVPAQDLVGTAVLSITRGFGSKFVGVNELVGNARLGIAHGMQQSIGGPNIIYRLHDIKVSDVIRSRIIKVHSR